MEKHVLSLVVVSLVLVLLGRGDSWQEIVPNGVVPPARAGHTMTFLNNQIYAFAGYDENREPTNTLSVFDVRSMRWVEHVPANDPPPARHGHSAVGYSGNLYIFFGQGADGLLGDIWRYDPAGNTWNPVNAGGTNQPTARSHASGNLIGNTAWFFGGYINATDGGIATDGGLWGLNFGTERWTRYAANANASRARSSIFHNSSRIYIFGGVDDENNVQSDIIEYNPGTNRWAEAPVEVVGDLPGVRVLAHHIGIHFGGFFWLFGGVEGVEGIIEQMIKKFDPMTLVWFAIGLAAPPMPPMENTAAEVIQLYFDRGDDPKLHFLFYGGEVDGVPTNTTWLYASDEPGPGLPPPQTSQFTLSFAEGWNIFSLPLEPVNPAVEAVLAEGTGRATLYRGDVWQWKPIGATGGGAYRMVDTLRALTGYLAYFPQAGDVVVEGFPTETSPALGTGWNLAGTAGEGPSPSDPGALRLPVWQWNQGGQRYQAVEPGQHLQPGNAYWFNAAEPFELNLDP